jgi:kumamolisin
VRDTLVTATAVGVMALPFCVLVAHPAAGSTPSQPDPATATFVPGVAARLQSSWKSVLEHSTDVGPSRATAVSVLVDLRGNQPPNQLEQWAARHRVRVAWSSGDTWAEVTGDAAQLGKALRVHIDDYRGPNGHSFYAARTTPEIPAAIKSDVTSLGSINSYAKLAALGEFDVPAGGISSAGLVKAYDAAPLVAQGYLGQGQTVVFFEEDGFSQSDFNKYTTAHNLPPMKATVIGGQAGSPEGETEMDMEVVHGIVPDARLVYFNFDSGGTAAGMSRDLNEVTRLYPGAIWSMSLGYCELGPYGGSLGTGFDKADFQTINGILGAADATGTTVFVASGDSGGFDCTPPQDQGDNPLVSFEGVSMPADFPAVVSVGGTALSVTSAGVYAGETSWTEPLVSQGSGGGISQLFAPPSWQTGPGTGEFGESRPGRQVPDVSADGDPSTGFAVTFHGLTLQSAGTSLAAPLWAAFTALIDQYLEHQGLKEVGFVNPDLYEVAAQSQTYPAFHDITIGGNAVYAATPGYDMVTGLGSPDVWNLARDLAALLRGTA